MNISDEKRHVYSMMKTITEERRELTRIYYDLKLRLDELDKLELRGLEDLSVKGYVDLHNANELKAVTTNIRREAEHVIKRIEKEIIADPVEKIIIPKAEIELEKEKEDKQRVVGAGLSSEKATGIIAHILKEHGAPMTVKDLFDEFSRRVGMLVTRNNFRNNILPRAAKRNRSIDNISRGFYQYLKQ